MKTLDTAAENDALNRLLEPFTRALTPAAARCLVNFRADKATQAHIAQLAEKCNEGQLSPRERREYEGYVRAIDLISILKAKARATLAKARND